MFFAIHRRESAMGIHVSQHPEPPSRTTLPPPSPLRPSGLSQSTSFHCFALCIKLALLIYFTYGKEHVSVLFYPISSYPHLLPHSSKVCSFYLCLFCCLAYTVIVTSFLNSYICINILYWCFSFWLTSLCIIASRFVHLIKTDSDVFFLWLSNIPLY